MATVLNEFPVDEEVMALCRTEGALCVLDGLGNYVDKHIGEFSPKMHQVPEVYGAVKMLTAMKELIQAISEAYKYPEREEQILEDALRRRVCGSLS